MNAYLWAIIAVIAISLFAAAFIAVGMRWRADLDHDFAQVSAPPPVASDPPRRDWGAEIRTAHQEQLNALRERYPAAYTYGAPPPAPPATLARGESPPMFEDRWPS